jgi:hypothetical protein
MEARADRTRLRSLVGKHEAPSSTCRAGPKALDQLDARSDEGADWKRDSCVARCGSASSEDETRELRCGQHERELVALRAVQRLAFSCRPATARARAECGLPPRLPATRRLVKAGQLQCLVGQRIPGNVARVPLLHPDRSCRYERIRSTSGWLRMISTSQSKTVLPRERST